MKYLLCLLILGLALSGCSNSSSQDKSSAADAEILIRSTDIDPDIARISTAIKSPNAKQAFDLVNQERRARGLALLQFESVCQRAAQEHVQNMISQDFFGHDSPTEKFRARMTRWDLLKHIAGENLAYVSDGNTQEVFEGWMKSPLHKKNIVSDQFRSAGMAYKDGYFAHCFSGKIP